MSDDLISLKVAILSDVASERALVRQAAAQASILIEVAELDAGADPKVTGAAITGESCHTAPTKTNPIKPAHSQRRCAATT